jgi:uncharacterized protein YndB with AHSA1/START domain
MSSVTVSTTIARPRERVFDFLDDLAHHQAFTDHFLVDWTVSRGRSTGVGAAARMRAKGAGRHPWVTITVVESRRPERTVEEGRGGKDGRRRTRGIYELADAEPGATKVSLTNEFEPVGLLERVQAPLARSYLRRQNARALELAVTEKGDAPMPGKQTDYSIVDILEEMAALITGVTGPELRRDSGGRRRLVVIQSAVPRASTIEYSPPPRRAIFKNERFEAGRAASRLRSSSAKKCLVECERASSPPGRTRSLGMTSRRPSVSLTGSAQARPTPARPRPTPSRGSERLSPQLTAFLTSAPILASSAPVNSFSAKEVGHMAPSSRFALSLKPNVAYLALNLCALWK